MTKKFLTATLLASSVFAFSSAHAGSCGSGVITQVKEGGWNSDHLMIKVDYSVTQSAHSGSEFQGFIRFKSDLSADRLKNIRALASLALLSGRVVSVFSHSGSCDAATELTVLNV